MLGEKELAALPFSARHDRERMLEGLYGTGIDDLAKYRIVQYLQECAGPVDAWSISSYLGLHPVELVHEALESLACKGILLREDHDPASYTINCRAPSHRELQRLFSLVSPQERQSMFRALAASSLAKAQARKRGEGNRRKA